MSSPITISGSGLSFANHQQKGVQQEGRGFDSLALVAIIFFPCPVNVSRQIPQRPQRPSRQIPQQRPHQEHLCPPRHPPTAARDQQLRRRGNNTLHHDRWQVPRALAKAPQGQEGRRKMVGSTDVCYCTHLPVRMGHNHSIIINGGFLHVHTRTDVHTLPSTPTS